MFVRLRTTLWQRLLLPMLIGCACGTFALADTDLRLHVAWGGGKPRPWRGRIAIGNGSFRDLNLLGMDADEPGSILLSEKQIVIAQRRERSYDGFEFSVSGPSTAILRVELKTVGDARPRVFDIPLQDLVSSYRSESLDQDNNRLVIRRAPGDYIRLNFQRDHLVFAPGESFLLNIVPHHLNVAPTVNVRCSLKLRKGRRRNEVWETSRTLRTDALGAIPAWNQCLVKIPEEEGVYDLAIALTNRRLAAPFSGDQPIAKRKLQLVVIGDQPDERRPGETLRLLADLDPTQKNWWQRMTKLPQWSLLPGLRSDKPLGNKETERWSHEGRVWTRLAAGGWQAYPLPIDEVGAEHELEVDFPGVLPQGFLVSIVEPNAAGKVIPVGLDSGVRVSEDDIDSVAVKMPTVSSHRLTFWPKSKSPLVLVTNLSDDEPAVFGRFRVYRREAQPESRPAPPDGRKAYAYFEKPLFPECFSATESLDSETGRSLEDWKTFHDGGVRLIRYLKRVGYNGLVLTCVSEGSTLYPSRILQPTPKHDRGVFFATGQDGVRKDVLEMLFRLCDREGITLVPAIEFATHLPALEQLRWQRDELAGGIDLLDSNGMTWVERHGAKRGRAPYYNPLNTRVQEEMIAVVREIASRYARHPSFGGISITLTPDGYTQLPDYDWAMDAQTIKRFTADVDLQSNGVSSIRNMLIYGKSRTRWLDWRSRQLATLYDQMGREVEHQRPDARLYMAGARLIESRPVQRAFRPALPRESNVETAMRELGLDIAHYQNQANIVFLRPHKITQTVPASRQGADIEFNLADEVDQYFDRNSASQFLHEPYRTRLRSFDEISPFGRGTTLMSLVAQVSPVSFQNRERFIHAMRVRDVDTIFEGGWLLPLGQERELQDLLQVYRQLPAERFEVALPDQPTQPLQIRQLVKDDRTYVYVVNDSPWSVTSTIRFDVAPGTRFESLANEVLEGIEQLQGQVTWNLELKPYDLVAVRATGVARANHCEVRLPPVVRPAIRDRITSLGSRAARLRDPPALGLLSNAGFEETPGPGVRIPGWSTEWISGISLQQEDVFEGKTALKVQATNSARTLLSDPIVPPESGRLSIAIRAKALDPVRQPRVRFVLRANETTYYPWAAIGADKSESQLSGEWKEFVFRVNHLPPIGSSLQIGIEVSGRGEVLIDDVRIYDILALDDNEQKVLANILSVAYFQLRSNHLSDCLHSLNGYWPRYLMNNVPEAQKLAKRPLPVDTEATEEPSTAGGWGRLKRLVPKIRR